MATTAVSPTSLTTIFKSLGSPVRVLELRSLVIPTLGCKYSVERSEVLLLNVYRGGFRKTNTSASFLRS
jgi:hypothetical protein